MIILEGPDGAGKTSLLKHLSDRFDVPIHKRFCTSEEGPIPNLFREVYDDMLTWDEQPCSIFDRHSLISEYVYSLQAREGQIDGQFLTGVAGTMLTKMAESSLVIMCLPPYDLVKSNVLRHPEKQMPGVVDNLYGIYQTYKFIYTLWPNPYRIRTYDYTKGEEEFNKIVGFCQLHISDWNRKQNK